MGALAANAAAMIADRGSSMTLRRTGSTDITVRGVRQSLSAIDAVGTAIESGFKVRIAPTEILASSWSSKVPTSSGDRLVIASAEHAILAVEPIYDGDTLAMYELTVAG